MKSTLSVPLKKQENLKELFKLMDQNGLGEEKKQVADLADYIDQMDSQFSMVLSELKDVKEQLGVIQDKGIKAQTIKLVDKVEGKVSEAKEQVQTIKGKFMAGVDKAVEEFKEKGIQALQKAVDVTGLKKGIEKIKEQLHETIEAADRGITHLGVIGDELHNAKAHLGNIGKELAGKEIEPVASRDVEKGVFFQGQKALYVTMGMLSGMEKRTESLISKLDKLEQHASKGAKASVKDQLKTIQAEKDGQATGKEKQPQQSAR